MFGKLALAFLVSVMLLQTPLFAAATVRCCANNEPHPHSFEDGCCAAMGCCALSSSSTEDQLNRASVANELPTVSAVLNLVSLIDLPIRPNETRFCQARPVAHSPPPLALLCTRLI
jgi:hypothetical protein